MEPEDGHWGVLTENGTWNGMIEMVMSNVSLFKYIYRTFVHIKFS